MEKKSSHEESSTSSDSSSGEEDSKTESGDSSDSSDSSSGNEVVERDENNPNYLNSSNNWNDVGDDDESDVSTVSNLSKVSSDDETAEHIANYFKGPDYKLTANYLNPVTRDVKKDKVVAKSDEEDENDGDVNDPHYFDEVMCELSDTSYVTSADDTPVSDSDSEPDSDSDSEPHADSNPKPVPVDNNVEKIVHLETGAVEDRIRKEITEKYNLEKGLKLYMRFPEKLPAKDEDLLAQVKALSSLVTAVRRPRQRNARFCMAEFASTEDRKNALKAIKKAKKNSKDDFLKRTTVQIPRTDSDLFVNSLIQQKVKSLEKKKAKIRLKKAGIAADREGKFTPTLFISNLPPRTSALEIRKAFPNAVDVHLMNFKAAVTLPSPFEARDAYNKPPTINGTLLKLRYTRNPKYNQNLNVPWNPNKFLAPEERKPRKPYTKRTTTTKEHPPKKGIQTTATEKTDKNPSKQNHNKKRRAEPVGKNKKKQKLEKKNKECSNLVDELEF